MYGTSWGGFNSLQVAMERPPALHAIVPIYASDDRYTDDVHYMGGVLKALDLVDWVIYMAACNVLPPVPAVYGEGWREEWRRRIDGTEPWLLRWLEEQDDGPYWRHGSLRPGVRPDHVPDDDRRGLGRRVHEHRAPRVRGDVVPAARDHRTVGAHVHGDVDPRAAHRPRARARPLVLPLAPRRAERDRRGAADRRVHAALDASGARSRRDARRVAVGADLAGGASPPAGPAAGRRRDATESPCAATSARRHGSRAPGSLPGRCRTTSARTTRARSPTTGRRSRTSSSSSGILGSASRSTSPHPVAFLSARLCDVFPDGTSALVSRGVLNLTHRDGHAAPKPLEPGVPTPVELELEATSWIFEAGHRVRLALAGSDWPNTWPPPHGGSLEVARASVELELPVLDGPPVAPAARRSGRPGRRSRLPRTRRMEQPAVTRLIDRRHGRAADRRRHRATDRGTTGRSARRSRSATTALVGVAASNPGRAWASARARYDIEWPETTVTTEAHLRLRSTSTARTTSSSRSSPRRTGPSGIGHVERRFERTIPRRLQ